MQIFCDSKMILGKTNKNAIRYCGKTLLKNKRVSIKLKAELTEFMLKYTIYLIEYLHKI